MVPGPLVKIGGPLGDKVKAMHGVPQNLNPEINEFKAFGIHHPVNSNIFYTHIHTEGAISLASVYGGTIM